MPRPTNGQLYAALTANTIRADLSGLNNEALSREVDRLACELEITVRSCPQVAPTTIRDLYTGRVAFYAEDLEDQLLQSYWERYGLSVIVGPELVAGGVCDKFNAGISAKLPILFEDFGAHPAWRHLAGNGSTQHLPSAFCVSEDDNTHTLAYIKELTPRQAWTVIRDRLARSGAIPLEE